MYILIKRYKFILKAGNAKFALLCDRSLPTTYRGICMRLSQWFCWIATAAQLTKDFHRQKLFCKRFITKTWSLPIYEYSTITYTEIGCRIMDKLCSDAFCDFVLELCNMHPIWTAIELEIIWCDGPLVAECVVPKNVYPLCCHTGDVDV